MGRTLVCWIGKKDLDGVQSRLDGNERQLGPILSTLEAMEFDRVELLHDYAPAKVAPLLEDLKSRVSCCVNSNYCPLSSPIHYGEIYQAANQLLKRITSPQVQLSILLSPGTPAMQAVWVLLGKTTYPCRFLVSSSEQGVKETQIPFELSAEYIPAARELSGSKLTQLANLDVPVDAAFSDIITHNPHMNKLKQQAQILAERDVPVLIYGETGTGKELFARAIHKASPRAAKPFEVINCGAIPSELVDSVLFGHKKGAFSGAVADHAGCFERAHGGTLFLDEFGELEPAVQVRLLRVLQEGEVLPVGGQSTLKVDVRIVTATHRDLMSEVVEGRFREDLFYRVAVGVLHLPPLRQREGDLSLLADSMMQALAGKDSYLNHKSLSPSAKNIIVKHPWRGNVRELQSTLLRAALWCQGDTITAEDLRQALFQIPQKSLGVMERDISQGIDLDDICEEVARHYIPLAMSAAGGKKQHAAELLGLKSYQTLENRMKKLELN